MVSEIISSREIVDKRLKNVSLVDPTESRSGRMHRLAWWWTRVRDRL
jgi:hypothetical protein